MATLIQIRRGTDAEWTSANPILSAGELALSTDLGTIKVGNGSSNWSSLEYITPIDTDDLTEGISNLYFTNSRAIIATSDAISSASAAAVASANFYTDSAVTNLIDSAPGALDTLNELAAALGDDANFATTVTNSLATKLDVSTASATYLTQSDAATSYDVIGSASAALVSAESYADSLAPNYDAVGSAASAQLAAESYADSLAPNYDAAGSASAALVSAEGYTDTAIGNLVNSAPETLDTLNELAAALGDDANFATTVTNSLATKLDVSTASATYLTGNQSISITGDATGSGSTSISLTLANSGVSAATYGSASAVPSVAIDAKGRVTSASTTPIAIAQSAVTNLTTDLGLKANLSSPDLTGIPTAPTAAAGTNTTQISTTAFVQSAISIIDGGTP